MIDSYGNNVFLMSKFPVRACCTKNEDGTHSIFINAGLSYKEQLKSYRHELAHIRNDDFREGNVQDIEKSVHEQNPPQRTGLAHLGRKLY